MSPCNVHPVPVVVACQELSPWATAWGTNLTCECRGGGARGEGKVRRREEGEKMVPGLGQGRDGFMVAPASLPLVESGSTPAVPSVCVSSQMPAPRAEAKLHMKQVRTPTAEVCVSHLHRHLRPACNR